MPHNHDARVRMDVELTAESVANPAVGDKQSPDPP
jgi:hypothetical protein